MRNTGKQLRSPLALAATRLVNKSGSFAITVLVMMMFDRCTGRVYYVSDPVVFGNVTKKGDFNLAGGLNGGSFTQGMHFHGSLATSHNNFVLASFTNYSGQGSDVNEFSGTVIPATVSGSSFLAGFGRYTHFGARFSGEVVGGAKYGTNHNDSRLSSFDYTHMKYFIQPAITFNHPFFQLGLGFRTGAIHFMAPKLNAGTIVQLPDEFVAFIDPAFYTAFGTRYVKLGFQFSLTFAEKPAMTMNQYSMAQSDPMSFSLFLKGTFPAKKRNASVVH